MLNFFLILVIVLTGLLNTGIAQSISVLDSADITAGISFTDGYFIGTRYRFGQNQGGLNLGTMFDPEIVSRDADNKDIFISLTYSRHLLGTSKFTHQRPWFVRIGLTYHYSHDKVRGPNFQQDTYQTRMYGRMYLGRDFNISSRIGTSFSLGPYLRFISRWKANAGTTYYSEPRKVFPGADLFFYYRLRRKK